MAQMKTKASEADAIFEAGESKFVSSDDPQTRKRNWQRLAMKERNAEQGQRKQDKIVWDTEEQDWLAQIDLRVPFDDPAISSVAPLQVNGCSRGK